jgi:cytochrome P450
VRCTPESIAPGNECPHQVPVEEGALLAKRLVSRRFTPRAMRGHEAHVREVVTEILDAVVPLGQCEAIEAIASRLPAIMISDLLGYPRELWERVRYWSEQTMVLTLWPTSAASASPSRCLRQMDQISGA